jgi:hypothetical protein
MPTRLSIQPHLSLDDLERRYRAAKEPVARSHWQIIGLLARGWLSEQVAASNGYTVKWVRTRAPRYNQQGPAGRGDRRHHNPGRVGLLSAAQRTALARVLDQPPGWRTLDRAPSGGLDGRDTGTAGASAAGLGEAATPELAPQSAAAATCQGQSGRTHGF